MPSLDTWITVGDSPRDPVLPDPEATAAEIKQRLAERRRYELPPTRTLSALRRSRGVSQEELARRIGAKQARLSKFERHPDPRLSGLRTYIAALGGTLILVAHFPDAAVSLTCAGTTPPGTTPASPATT